MNPCSQRGGNSTTLAASVCSLFPTSGIWTIFMESMFGNNTKAYYQIWIKFKYQRTKHFRYIPCLLLLLMTSCHNHACFWKLIYYCIQCTCFSIFFTNSSGIYDVFIRNTCCLICGFHTVQTLKHFSWCCHMETLSTLLVFEWESTDDQWITLPKDQQCKALIFRLI